MHTLNATSFNLRLDTRDDGDNRWDNRKDFAIQTIRELNPDVLATQEPRPYQVDFLDQHLGDYHRVGWGREDGKNKGEFSPLHLKKSRFDLLESGQFWLSPTPEVPGSMGWDAHYVRQTIWLRARDRLANRTLLVMNTHWDNKGEIARLESSKQIRRWFSEHARDQPILFLGDLNSGDDNPQVKSFLDPAATPRLLDAYRTCHPAVDEHELTIHHYTGETKGARIDYIIHTPHFTATSASIIRRNFGGKYPSDHYPLAATLEWV